MIETIDSIKKLLKYVNPGKFGQIVLNYIVFQGKADQKDVIKLDLNGYMIYVYLKAFKESPPTETPTPLQRERINAIWDALGHPERKI